MVGGKRPKLSRRRKMINWAIAGFAVLVILAIFSFVSWAIILQ